MNQLEVEDVTNSNDYNVNIRILAFATTSIILIIVAIFFVRTYASQRQDIIRTMHAEGELLEIFCAENMNHTWYVIYLLTSQIKKKPHDIEYVYGIFDDYLGDHFAQDIFGWTEFFWYNSVTNKNIRSSKNNKNALPEFSTSQFTDKISYVVDDKNHALHAALGIRSETHDPIGSVLVSFDIHKIVERLKSMRKHKYTNVALIGEGLQVVLQSNLHMENAGIENGKIVDEHTKEVIAKMDFMRDTNGDASYLDMFSGKNFYVKKIKGLPFVLLINIDDAEIKHDLYYSVAMKLLEISFIASCFLLALIFIYRRETWLRRRAESSLAIATEATNAKSDFLSFTAHEIRAPLGFILTGSEMMQKELLGPISQNYIEYVDGIHNNANLILEFITDILDEAHILEGNFKIVNNPANVEEIIRNSISLNQAKFTKKNLTIDIDIENKLPQLICDSRRILQVINNLLSNAAQYSLANTMICVIVKIVDDRLCIKIKDEGVGMTQEEIKIAFAKYGTIRKKNFNFVDSYGLGLPIVKMLLDAHGAELKVKSYTNKGTCFTIIFPKEKLDYTLSEPHHRV